ncbi:MAG: hypothetical protein J6V42_00510 [Clostridia bacterium]|nr:hypothetical protein [Clostridia bacterium]
MYEEQFEEQFEGIDPVGEALADVEALEGEDILQDTKSEDVLESDENADKKELCEDGEDLLGNDREALKAEIESLKAELDIRSKVRERYVAEFREFSEIFGKDTLDNVPESVWERVEAGVPLAAAYALYEKKNALLLEKAEAVNKKNAAMTTGEINNATVSGFFSPSEVKAMSAKEVRKNYDLIIESMKKWN